MPAANYPEQMNLEKNLARTSTATRRMQKNLDNANVRVVAEAKMSDRKKVRTHVSRVYHFLYNRITSKVVLI